MITFKNNHEIDLQTIRWDTDEQLMYVINTAELSLFDQVPDIKSKVMEGFNPDDCTSKYECYDGHDMLYVNIPEELQDKNSFRFLGVYISSNLVVCVCEEWDTEAFIANIIRANMAKGISYKKIILSLIDNITRDDFTVLGDMEDTIADIEDLVSGGEIESGIEEISLLRRKIRPMKRFYEHLIDAFEDLDENENNLFTETDLRYASRINGRIDRLYRTVINLRDYITQVREAYQAQMDIGLNRIMKTFTVITAIFLPLTLVVGWYGMNLRMPETDWQYGYLFVSGLSLIIVIVCLIYFKVKKWF